MVDEDIAYAVKILQFTNTPSFWLPDFNFGSAGFGSISNTGKP